MTAEDLCFVRTIFGSTQFRHHRATLNGLLQGLRLM